MDRQLKIEDRLSQLVVPIAVWGAHFLVTYAVAAIWCAKLAPGDGRFGALGWAIGLLTAAALGAFALVVRAALRRYHEVPPGEPDADTDMGRHRFLAEATISLSSLGALGVVYVALSFALVGECG